MNLRVKIKRLHPDAIIPKYARKGDAGLDLIAVEDVIIEPGETKIVPTGIAISLPPGYEAQIRPRSGITVKTKLRVALGTIDSGYTGEIGVIVDNIAPKHEWTTSHPLLVSGEVNGTWEFYGDNEVMYGSYIIRKGDRIGQAVIAPIAHATFTEVDELGETTRGSNGFGSSGVKASFNKAVVQNGKAFEDLAKEENFNEQLRKDMAKKGMEAARKWAKKLGEYEKAKEDE